jgi:hypothetical protein
VRWCAIAILAALAIGCGGDEGPTCGDFDDPAVFGNAVRDIHRELIPPGSPDDDPRDTPPASRAKFRQAIARELFAVCAREGRDFHPREAVLRELDSD